MKRYNKYNARRTYCQSGHYHPSMLEASYCDQLFMLKKAGEIKDFEYQKQYDLEVNGKHICNHRPDFTVTDNDNKISVHETKGCATQDWIMRKRIFEAVFPDIPYIVIR